MSTTIVALGPCPSWCIVPREDHDAEVRRDGTTFHLAHHVDTWALGYRNQPVKVIVDSFEAPAAPEHSSGPTINIDGDLGRGSLDYAELEVTDARRLALALLRACEVIEPTATSSPATSAAGHPTWCTAHNGFDDGSGDWHQSADFVAGSQTFYVSDGTRTGLPEVFTANPMPESMTLDQTEKFARALLVAVASARQGSN